MKKLFKVVYEAPDSDKHEEAYYVANDFADLFDAMSIDEARKVLSVSVGPSVEVL